MSDASTLRGRHNIKVAEYGDGTPWVMIEVEKGDFPIMQGGFAGLDLKKGATYQQARELVDLLNRLTENFTITIFHSAPGTKTVQ
jgi:hypothetical protein